uniref:Transcription factor CBF/NF-Y/archaeal histone domain-containing protein n=1 Tax=Salix viminalis TaxID=40686 RepID=A0A6N2LEA1_SALVM
MDDKQDQLLPIANVGRVMKQRLPPTARVSKEAKQRMQECATEFISFVTGEASSKCRNGESQDSERRRWFDDYADSIVRYLHKYREAEKANQKKPTDTGKVNKDEESSHTGSQAAQQQTDQIPEPTLEFRFL